MWFHWQARKEALLAELLAGEYRLSPMQVIGWGKTQRVIWGAQDAVVLKWAALQLADVLPVHPLCEHHRGHGGGKASVQRMEESLRRERWAYVCRTDIQGFYGHIRRGPLMRQLRRHISDPVLLGVVRQYLHYSVERGGEFYTPNRGICRGCALSPLLAGFCLWAMDTYFEAQRDLRYVRYMDDFVIFSRTRWALRRAVRTLNVFFAAGGYRQHPAKTFIGKTEKGFDWMGIQFNRSGIVGVAPRAMANHRERCRRLYEQVWRWGKVRTLARLSAYVKRWKIWRYSMINKTYGARKHVASANPLRRNPTYVPSGVVRCLIISLFSLGSHFAHASTLPGCVSILGGHAMTTLVQTIPDGRYPPGTAAGYVQGTGVHKSGQCIMNTSSSSNNDYRRLGLVYGASERQGNVLKRIAPGVWDLDTTGARPGRASGRKYRIVHDYGQITCTDSSGTHTASFPADAVRVTISGTDSDMISVPCDTSGGGTAYVSLDTSDTRVEVPGPGEIIGQPAGTTGNELFDSNVVNLMAGSLAVQYPNDATEMGPLGAAWLTAGLLSGQVTVPFVSGNTSCNTNWTSGASGSGELNWGTLSARHDAQVGDAVGTGQNIVLTTICNGVGTSSAGPRSAVGVIRGQPSSGMTGGLLSDNPSIAFKFTDSESGKVIIPNTSACVSGTVWSDNNATSTTSWRMGVVPVVDRLPLIPGKTLATAVVDLYLGYGCG